MPILKTNILGSNIDIHYEEGDKDKLIELINKFKKRLINTSNNGKISVSKIIFIAALKLEDQLNEYKYIINENNIEKKKIIEQNNLIENLNNQITNLKKDIHESKNLKLLLEDDNKNAINAISELEESIKLIQVKIKKSI